MNIYSVIHIILKQAKWLIILPIIASVLMFFATINEKSEFNTKATLFTAITSGSSLSNLENSRIDFFASKTAYNNLITILNSRNVQEETSLRLLAKHLQLTKPDPAILSKDNYDEFVKTIPDDIKQLVVKNNEQKTYENLIKYLNQDKTNFLYELLNFNHPHYSFKAISSIKTTQVSGSDIIELTYTSNDAGVAYHTLNIVIEVFLNTYSDLKVNQASAVIAYFEKQLKTASKKLADAEDRLLNFNKENKIINYYEQTKHISSQQEKIEIKLHDILLEYQAAEAILLKLEEQTQSRYNINLKNREIINLRESLVKINKNLASLDFLTIDEAEKDELKLNYIAEQLKLKQILEQKLDSLYIYEKHSDGIAIETLLNDWLSTVIDYESAKARLQSMEVKSEEFKKLYNQFAPLGATLKRIEREIDVNEKSYLEILHHLGLARLKQQNEELMANMKVLDKPFFPIDPEPTKRKLMVVVIGIFTLILTLLGFFVFELLDRTIKTPKRLQNLGYKSVIGVLPLKLESDKINFDDLTEKGLKSVVDELLQQHFSNNKNIPIIVNVFSHFSNEGKTYMINSLYKILEKLDIKVLLLNVKPHKENGNWLNLPGKNLMNSNYYQIINNIQQYDIVIVEMPPLSDKDYFINNDLVISSELNLMIINANRTWSATDNYMKDKFIAISNNSVIAILNQAIPDNMVDMVGEIQKKRSLIRRFIKNRFFKKYVS
ncbi:GumC family protein [Plebeiibacterium sediminum]|uniref:Polysaccharide chain length determinant N-terminal domain-containing protein n=1 Tax=Plebeiibacterium sediminum TaxID=2992112 RepID=A0AAE3M564_9BACT|nr:hypothetical protein [Plebeiobacterium sediminum]MCW3787466.1 hypothetical protein [Plebeiobacterium sediminum]